MPVIAGDIDVDTYKWPRLHGVAVATFFFYEMHSTRKLLKR